MIINKHDKKELLLHESKVKIWEDSQDENHWKVYIEKVGVDKTTVEKNREESYQNIENFY